MLFQLGHDHRAAQNPINIVTNITSHKNGHINPIKNNTNEIKKQEIRAFIMFMKNIMMSYESCLPSNVIFTMSYRR